MTGGGPVWVIPTTTTAGYVPAATGYIPTTTTWTLPTAGAPLSDHEIERIARRVAELLKAPAQTRGVAELDMNTGKWSTVHG